MSTFGPFYPSPLLESITHAERFLGQLDLLDIDLEIRDIGRAAGSSMHSALNSGPNRGIAEAWLQGRDEEIEAFVGDVVAEWRSKRLSAVGAALAIDRYLDTLHDGLAAYFGLAVPTCCTRPSVTRIAVEAATQVAPFLEVLAQSLRERPSRDDASGKSGEGADRS